MKFRETPLPAGMEYLYHTSGEQLKLYAVSNHTTALLGGGPLNVDYEFVEMHFHWGKVRFSSLVTVSQSVNTY